MATAGLALAVLTAEAASTHVRNQVWHTEESLWRDVTVKSPKNGVGLMNYGIALMGRNDFADALPYLKRAHDLMPDYYSADINLGLAYAGLNRDDDAVHQFEQAVSLAPTIAEPYFYYGRWLKSKGRLEEAQAKLETALKVNPNYFQARSLLIELYTAEQKWRARDRLIEESLKLTHNDELARQYVQERSTPQSLLRLSAKYCNQGNYTECLGAAQEAIELRPDYAEAYSNVAAAYIAMQKWDEGIQAAREALRLKPGYEAAKSNLEWALSHRK
jgi:tetratricopeptide (TPR) repeat protein